VEGLDHNCGQIRAECANSALPALMTRAIASYGQAPSETSMISGVNLSMSAVGRELPFRDTLSGFGRGTLS
jgi:hypothetical protein